MDKKLTDRFLALQDRAKSDPEYQQLCREAPAVEAALLGLLQTLSPEQQDTLLDYIGFYWELYRAMLRIACTDPGGGAMG